MLGSSCFYFHSVHHRHEAEAVRSESHCLLLHDEWVCKSFHAPIASTLHNLNMYELIHIHTVTYSMVSNRELCALYGDCNIAVAICEATSKLCSILHVFNVPMLWIRVEHSYIVWIQLSCDLYHYSYEPRTVVSQYCKVWVWHFGTTCMWTHFEQVKQYIASYHCDNVIIM